MIEKWLLDRAALAGLEEAIDQDITERPQWSTRLKCPVCGESFQHAGDYQHIPGRDNYEAGWGGRGDLLIIPVWCEFEHTWQLCLGFHKGATFIFPRVPDQQGEVAA